MAKMDKHNVVEKDFFITALKEEARSALEQVGSSTDPEALIKSVLHEIEALAPRPEGQEDRSDDEIRRQVRACLLKAAYATRPYCMRCGTCCTKGSPTLLADDIVLFNRDLLKPSDVITVRKGEWVRAHARDELEPTEKELIKIREIPGSTSCIFFEPKGQNCSIYDARPLQCRQQECWDPQDCDEIRDQAVLNRAALLSETRPLWDIILRHEERCSCEELARVMAKLGATRGQAVEELLELLRFDQHVRSFIKENFRLAAEAMDFFLGRSLSQAVEPYGLRVVEEPDGSFLLTMLDDAGDQ